MAPTQVWENDCKVQAFHIEFGTMRTPQASTNRNQEIHVNEMSVATVGLALPQRMAGMLIMRSNLQSNENVRYEVSQRKLRQLRAFKEID